METTKEVLKKVKEWKNDEVKIWDVCPGMEFDAERDLKITPSWFPDRSHPVPPWTPFQGWLWHIGLCTPFRVVEQEFSFPHFRASQVRFAKGVDFVGVSIIRDPEEIKKREPKFKEAMRPYFEDFDGWWNARKEELMSEYTKAKNVDLDSMSLADLWHHFDGLIQLYRKMGLIHFRGMLSSHSAWMMLDAFVREKYGLSDRSPEFLKMMQGFNTKAYQIDKRLWELGKEAVDKGLKDIFLDNGDRDVIAKLEQVESGKEWIKGFRDFLWEDGWRIDRLAEVIEPSWVEDPTPAIINIKSFIRKGVEYSLDDTRAKLIKEREDAVAAMLGRASDEDRGWLEKLIGLAQKAGEYGEDHTYYCEHYCHSLLRRALLAIGKQFVDSGSLDNVDDVFFLIPEEIDSFLPCPVDSDLRWIANRRREQWEGWQKEEMPIVITTRDSIEEAVGMDLVPSMHPVAVGVVLGGMPDVKPEVKADLWGLSASSGVTEGIARVVLTHEQLYEVQPGEILVAPTTSSSWTIVFNVVSAVVTDSGGTLGHPAIMAREFGIPAVVNSFEATQKIKTGDRIRVDGDQGCVQILS